MLRRLLGWEENKPATDITPTTPPLSAQIRQNAKSLFENKPASPEETAGQIREEAFVFAPHVSDKLAQQVNKLSHLQFTPPPIVTSSLAQQVEALKDTDLTVKPADSASSSASTSAKQSVTMTPATTSQTEIQKALAAALLKRRDRVTTPPPGTAPKPITQIAAKVEPVIIELWNDSEPGAPEPSRMQSPKLTQEGDSTTPSMRIR